MHRRDLFTAGAAMASLGFFSTRSSANSGKKAAARFAHITDTHILDGREAADGTKTAFDHMFARKESPEFILNTGDAVMSIDGGNTTSSQVATWTNAVQKVKVPIYSCLGNHDYWHGKDATDAMPAELKYEKLMIKTLGMPGRWFSFNKAGWHFISLDSMADWPKGYGYLTPEEFDWLKDDLKKTPKETPVCVISHLPILSVTSLVYGDACKTKTNSNNVPGAWQHSDCWAISEIFRRHPNVKLCLSGHMHTQDRCEYRGVWYICGGALSGAWWNGAEYGFPPCYGMVTLYAGGEFDYEFIDYGWKARKWSGKELKE